ncbi:Histone-lysine N-methyltransferase SETMAR, partial [Harpegnathos saltator]
SVYGEASLTERQCQHWFTCFHSRDFSVKDAPRLDRPIEIDDDRIKELLKSNRHYTTQEIVEKLNISCTSIENCLKELGYVNKLDIWVPHELIEIHLTKHINISHFFLKRKQNDLFLKQMLTDDEKWIVYDNVERKRSWSKHDEPLQSTSKTDIQTK